MGIDEVAHQMALLPVYLLGGLLLLGRLPSPEYLGNYILFAGSLAMSWVGDSMMRANGGSFDLVYIWAPVQITLAFAAVIDFSKPKHVLIIALAYSAALFSHILQPEKGFVLYIIGGIGLIFCARKSLLLWPIAVYFGGGAVAYYFMIAYFAQPGFMVTWYTYQGCRAASILLFCSIIFRSSREARDVVAC